MRMPVVSLAPLAHAVGAAALCFGVLLPVAALPLSAVAATTGTMVDAQQGARIAHAPTTFMTTDHRGTLYLAHEGTGTVDALPPDGSRLVLATGLGAIGGIAVDTLRNVYVTDTATGRVLRIAPDGRVTPLAEGLAHPGALVMDRDGGLVVHTANQQLVRISSR